MSHKLISHSPDLKRLREEGYEIEIRNAHLLVHHVPYINSKKEILLGMLVTALGDLAGDRTSRPQDHVIYFAGEFPCDENGNLLKGIKHSSDRRTLTEGVDVDHSFSNKPPEGYSNYYDKVTSYIRIISSHAESLDHSMSPKTFVIPEARDGVSVFCYDDANSVRAEIDVLSARLKGQKIAIIGLGGTGSYVLDLVAKTPVAEIHLFDDDDFLSHNAFRAPGAPSIDILRGKPRKVEYLQSIYSKMHEYVLPHDFRLSGQMVDQVDQMSFVFICIDAGEAKKCIIQRLVDHRIPFVDTGIGICDIDGMLTGSARITTGTPAKIDHLASRIAFSGVGENEYDKNVQVAEINALNAALAVIKWKKCFGFYHDSEKEHNAVYNINDNKLINDETINA